MALLEALSLLGAVWSLVVLGGVLFQRLGESQAVALSFGFATWLTLRARPGGNVEAVPWRVAALGFASGYALLPGCAAVSVAAGRLLGIDGRAPTLRDADPALYIASLALAPIFEELLYRERLLPALRARVGSVAALLLTSLLFALPHAEAWSMLGSFVAGLLLGTCMLLGGSVWLCVGVHAGFNAAVLSFVWLPMRATLPGALIGIALIAIAIPVARRR